RKTTQKPADGSTKSETTSRYLDANGNLVAAGSINDENTAVAQQTVRKADLSGNVANFDSTIIDFVAAGDGSLVSKTTQKRADGSTKSETTSRYLDANGNFVAAGSINDENTAVAQQTVRKADLQGNVASFDSTIIDFVAAGDGSLVSKTTQKRADGSTKSETLSKYLDSNGNLVGAGSINDENTAVAQQTVRKADLQRNVASFDSTIIDFVAAGDGSLVSKTTQKRADGSTKSETLSKYLDSNGNLVAAGSINDENTAVAQQTVRKADLQGNVASFDSTIIDFVTAGDGSLVSKTTQKRADGSTKSETTS